MTVTFAAVNARDALPTWPQPFLGSKAPPARMLAAALALLPAARGKAALLLPPRGRCAPDHAAGPHRWRMAEAILQAAAAGGGGSLLRSASGGSLLLGTSPGAARQAAAALGRLAAAAGGDPPPLPVWILPGDAGVVLDWAAAQQPAPAPPPSAEAVSPAGLQPVLEAIPATLALRAERLAGPGVDPAEAAVQGMRLFLHQPAIAAALGPLATDPDLLAHAMERLAARLLPGLAAWAGGRPGLRLIPLGQERLPGPVAAPGAFAVLPLDLAADPGLPQLRNRLAERGWALALEGLVAASLDLVNPRHLPADLLLLRWSPALAAPGRLTGLDPSRLLLVGAETEAARAFARAAGLRWARRA